jgi:flagellum-specific ATP synthase
LVQIGAYVNGSDAGLDEAIQKHDGMARFLQQDMHESSSMAESLLQMNAAIQNEGGRW